LAKDIIYFRLWIGVVFEENIFIAERNENVNVVNKLLKADCLDGVSADIYYKRVYFAWAVSESNLFI
jgi:hypothetical protein